MRQLFIKDKSLFAAVVFCERMIAEGKALSKAVETAANYYKVEPRAVFETYEKRRRREKAYRYYVVVLTFASFTEGEKIISVPYRIEARGKAGLSMVLAKAADEGASRDGRQLMRNIGSEKGYKTTEEADKAIEYYRAIIEKEGMRYYDDFKRYSYK